ncbi:hypothetical protein GY45DRAFT_1376211 [Cubamyces sp. BRFM 1775]|nr:hypothetical protein GY45DRAFT_1376211 [Cubamyces sp. BRFM 1775]
MSTPTYLTRVQKAFSELVNSGGSTIAYSELLRQMRPRVLRSSTCSSSPFRKDVRAAVVLEIRAERISVDVYAKPVSLLVTPAGRQFYTDFVLRSSTRRPSVRFLGPRRATAVDYYTSLAALASLLRAAVQREQPGNPDSTCVEKIPRLIRGYLETEAALRTENGELINRINELHWEIDLMQRPAHAHHQA